MWYNYFILVQKNLASYLAVQGGTYCQVRGTDSQQVFLFFFFCALQEALDGIEFARGDANSTWGSVRAAMGHPDPFDLRYVAVGNEDCPKKNYRGLHTVVNHF